MLEKSLNRITIVRNFTSGGAERKDQYLQNGCDGITIVWCVGGSLDILTVSIGEWSIKNEKILRTIFTTDRGLSIFTLSSTIPSVKC